MKNILVYLSVITVISATPNYALSDTSSNSLGIDVSKFGSLSKAIANSSTWGKSLIVSTPVNCSDLAIRTDQTVIITRGGSINVAPGKTLNINGTLVAGLYRIFTGRGFVVFGKGSVTAVKASWFGNDGLAVQSAVNAAASHIKKVSIVSGTYGFDSPLQMPVDMLSWGIVIEGAKSELKYQALPGSFATIFKANNIMNSVITNRSGNTAAYYNVFRNIVIDGNNKAVNGYINGYQDRLLDTTVINCTGDGIYLGDMTNSTILERVSSTLNKIGLHLDGNYSTVSYVNNSNFRQNSGAGIYITAAIGAHFINTISESNGGEGLKIFRLDKNPKKLINHLLFTNSYFENNTKYAISISGDSLSASNIKFDRPLINAKHKGVQIIHGDDITIDNPTIDGFPLTKGWFNVSADANRITLVGPEGVMSSTNFSLDGDGATKVIKMMTKISGQKGFITDGAIYTLGGRTQTVYYGINSYNSNANGQILQLNLGGLGYNTFPTLSSGSIVGYIVAQEHSMSSGRITIQPYKTPGTGIVGSATALPASAVILTTKQFGGVTYPHNNLVYTKVFNPDQIKFNAGDCIGVYINTSNVVGTNHKLLVGLVIAY